MNIELNEHTKAILGLVCFRAVPIARLMRDVGHEIDTKAEAEQAAVIHWKLNLYLEHGEKWQEVAGRQLDEWIKKAKSKSKG